MQGKKSNGFRLLASYYCRLNVGRSVKSETAGLLQFIRQACHRSDNSVLVFIRWEVYD